MYAYAIGYITCMENRYVRAKIFLNLPGFVSLSRIAGEISLHITYKPLTNILTTLVVFVTKNPYKKLISKCGILVLSISNLR